MALYTSLENIYIKKDIKQFAGLVTPEFYKYTLEPFESYMSSTGIKVVDIDVDVKSADIKKINWGYSIGNNRFYVFPCISYLLNLVTQQPLTFLHLLIFLLR